MDAISQLTQAITAKDRLQDCSDDELRQMTRVYPFFAPAQVLYARKKKDMQDEEAAEQQAKASLFVPNPLWFEELINEGAAQNFDCEEDAHDTILETPATEEEVIEQTPASIARSILPEETVHEDPATVEEVIEQPSAQKEEVFTEEPEIEQASIDASLTDTLEDDQESEEEPGYEDITTSSREEPLRPIPGFKEEPFDPAKAELSFEPYHTVDYFASQGIRFKEEEKPRDRLGQQLKSFTEWLKTLKKMPATEIVASTNTTKQEEKTVEQMAQVSLSEREVVTEAMAEVWEKQGNIVKAQELYKKLSLLDPSKSAYFAAKIEHLKQL